MLKNYFFQDFGHKREFGDQPVIRESIRVKVFPSYWVAQQHV